MKKTSLILASALAASSAFAAIGDPILFNVMASGGTASSATIADFSGAGVAGDLSAAALNNVTGTGGNGSIMSGLNGITLTNGGGANGPYNNGGATVTGPGASIMQNYLALKDRGEVANTMTIGGLSTQLLASTDYILYLWGAGDVANQNAVFTYGGDSITVASTDPDVTNDATNYLATFNFTTGAAVADTLAFGWADAGNQYSGFNGFAIAAAVPEPGTYALFAGAFALGAVMIRRRRA